MDEAHGCFHSMSNGTSWARVRRAKLAAAAKVSPDTVVRFERGERIRKRTIDGLGQVLEAAGVEFTDGKLKVTGLIFWSLEKARRDRTGLLPPNA